MRLSPRALILSLVIVTAASPACRKKGSSAGGLKVKPAAEARAASLGAGVMPNLDRSFERVGAIARELNLPFDASGMKTQALSSMKLPASVVAGVDTSAPVAIAVFPPAAAGKPPQVVVAASLKSADAGKQIITSLGKPIGQREAAAGYKAQDGTEVWLWQQDKKMVAAETADALVNGAALALESMRAGDDDVVATVYPEAIARSQGTDMKTAVGKLIQQMQEAPNTAGQTPATRAMVQSVMSAMLQRFTETDEAQLTVHADVKRGGTIGMKLRPKAGSTFAQDTAKTAPYALDTAVIVDDPMMIGATSPMPSLATMWRAMVAPMANIDASLVKMMEPLMSSITGAGSFSARMVKDRWQQVGIYQLSPGTSPQTYMDAVVALSTSPVMPKLMEAMGMSGKPTMKREKDVVVGEMKLNVSKLPPQQAQTMKSMFGDKFEFAFTAKDGRVYTAAGADARGMLASLTAATPAAPRTPTGDLATAIDETRGADGFLYMDLMQSMKAGMAGTPMGQAPGMAGMRLPMWFAARGGQTASYEWRIPMTSFRSVGALVPLFMMMAGGAGGAGMGAPGHP